MATAGLQFPAASQQNSSSVLPTTDGTPQHKRTYQACIPCRRRKVRCDLGSVDNPHDPPCVRCRRESKECYFSATRRKRKTAEGDGSGDGEYEDDFEVRNSRKRLRSRSETPPIAIYRQQNSVHTDIKPGSSNYSPLATSFPKPPLTPGGSFGRAQPLRRPRSETQDGSDSKSPQAQYTSRVPRQNPYPATVRSSSTATSAEGLEEDAHLTNSTAAALLRTEVYNGHDALNLLFEAAGRTEDIARRHKDGHGGSQQSSMPGIGSLGSHGQRSSEGLTNGSAENDSAHLMAPPRSIPGNPPIDPAMTNGTAAILNTDEAKLQPALKAWSRFRFIRAGWFTAREAILYIDYFYTYLAPLTPISPPNFHAPSTHATLLTEEPILTVTLLTVSSRYMKLPGAGGLSRSYSVHEKLWTYLRGMIERMVWGQEQFGGSLRPETIEDDGDTQTSSTAPWRGARKGNLRTLGTVESLMLLTEWHPRALHFPPGDDGDELLVREDLAGSNSSDLDAEDGKSKGIGGKRLESYLEPAWRSDRMCWMLLGNAMALSFELGVFDDVDDTSPHGGELHRPEYGQEAYRVRAKRVQKLLVIFVTQLAGRLEWNSNMVPPHISNSAFPKIPSPQQEHASIRKQINGESLRDAPKQNIFATPKYSLPVDNVHQCWLAIANLMKRGNELIFRNKNHTRDIIRSGRYVSLLNYFQPLLREWRQNFDSLDIPTHIRHILSIEADYVRMYINSLALQAVVERLSNNANNENLHSTLSTASMSPTSRSMPGNIPPSTLMSLYGGDQEFVKEVVEASRSLLSTVVEGLLPNEYLKHCPIRTYFRIISGAMFLLKTFALGANEDEVAISLGLMDSTVNGLRNCVVDDVHMGIRFADLLDTLTSRIRARFVRMAATGNNGTARAESKSPAPQNPRRSSNHPPQFPEQQQVYTPQWTPGGYEQQAYINAPDGRSTPNPLFGISTESIDPSGGNVSIMPPPSFGFPQGFEGGAPAIQHTDRTFVPSLTEDTNGQYMPDWLALPLDPLLQYGAGVSQTEVGPDVGGYDLLEILLSEMEEGASGV